MAYKLLQNLIAPKTTVQHLKGEIVDLTDPAMAEDLVARGIVEEVESAATHQFGVAGSHGSTGGKLVEGAKSQVQPPEPSTQGAQRTPQAQAEPEDNISKSTEKGQPIGQAAQDQLAPDLNNPAPKQSLTSRVKSAVTGQPTPEDVANTAASQN